MKKKVSIIIPVYNAEKYLDRCITSIINQTYKDLDIILINDGSKDKSLEICNKYNEKEKRIRVFDKKNSGVSDTRNYGIREAIGDYITFVDSDDYIDKDYIKNLVENFENNSYVRIANLNYSEENLITDREYSINEFIKKILKGKYIFCVWGGLFDKNLIGNFDNNTYYMEDAIFLIEYLKKCSRVKLIVSSSIYHYVDNPNSITNNKHNVLKNINSYFYSLNKINELTNLKYEKLIKEKKFSLIEKECRFVNTFEEYRSIKNNEEIKNLLKESNLIKKITFSNYVIFKTYYFVRKIAKKVYHIFK